MKEIDFISVVSPSRYNEGGGPGARVQVVAGAGRGGGGPLAGRVSPQQVRAGSVLGREVAARAAAASGCGAAAAAGDTHTHIYRYECLKDFIDLAQVLLVRKRYKVLLMMLQI